LAPEAVPDPDDRVNEGRGEVPVDFSP
jgi:hypothetical protein